MRSTDCRGGLGAFMNAGCQTLQRDTDQTMDAFCTLGIERTMEQYN